MERISVFDILKIGIGPSSSHTLGPWKACLSFIEELKNLGHIENVLSIDVWLYGSLAKTGIGHGTDLAIIHGLSGHDPVTFPIDKITTHFDKVKIDEELLLDGKYKIVFDYYSNIQFLIDQTLPFHSNGLTFIAHLNSDEDYTSTFYSIGGGFVVKEEEASSKIIIEYIHMPFPIDNGLDLEKWCKQQGLTIPQVVLANETALRPQKDVYDYLDKVWEVMKECIFLSCKKYGELPGGLGLERRSKAINDTLLNNLVYESSSQWMQAIRDNGSTFNTTLKWLSCFALAVNEENASFGRVVTAPTNGAAGVIPAVLMFHQLFSDEVKENDIYDFLLTASEMGSIFKKGATISAAMGGCQAEIGVSSAMAAAGLTQVSGGSPQQVMMAAEIAMEHHLGMTCDPIGGLVQIPCIERNTMGAIKAVMACQIALSSDPSKAKVSLDQIVKTMKETAKDMNNKYKETAEGGLAINVSVGLAEC
jgi:L-serine dehydratase